MFRISFVLLCVFSFLDSVAQGVSKEAIVSMKMELRTNGNFLRTRVDNYYVRNGFILEPIQISFTEDEMSLGTKSSKSTSKEVSSGMKLKGYNLTNFKEKVGMAFDIETKPSPKTIEIYELDPDKSKSGIIFGDEPYLSNGLTLDDYSKEKDTIINGQKCFLVKRNKVIQNVYRGRKMEKVVQFRLAINPLLKSYAFPFISEKIAQHFGGGAIVYTEGTTESGFRSILRYTYSNFSQNETTLFNYYQDLYNSNVILLDKFKRKR